MMYSFRVLLALGCLLAAGGLRAQSTLPTLPASTQAIGAQTLVAGGDALTLNLAAYFKVANLTGSSVIQFDTVKGKFNAQLFSADAPKTVTNFLGYVNRGNYTNNLIHRSQSDFVIQGGGFYLVGSAVTPITTQAAVQNEYKLSNVRGTIAMAKSPAGPDTATSQWFVNLGDNSTTLNTQNNGGFTVFGQVIGTGMTVVDAIAAVPTYNASAQLGADFTQLPLLNNDLTVANLVLVKSITPVPVYPDLNNGAAVLHFTVTNSNAAVAKATVVGSALILKPLSVGSTTITVRATDTNDNFTEASFGTIVVAAPLFTTQPVSQGVAMDGAFTLSAVETGSPSMQWRLNDSNINGAAAPTINFQIFQASNAGLFTAAATIGNAVSLSQPAVVGLSVPVGTKVVGLGQEVGSNIYVVGNNKTYDQVLLQGAAAGVTADFSPVDADNQITRTSYIDLDGDIVQVEYSGPGTLSIVLEQPTGPALPAKYNQSVSYMQGHASIIITGANEYSNVSVFSVGRITAVNQALFKSDVTYGGVADIGLIAIATTNGKFGGVRTANARYYNVKGYTGIYAPGVAFQGPVFIGDLDGFGTARAVMLVGSATDVRVTGGDMLQDNNQPVQVSGFTRLQFTPGIDSHGNGLPALADKAVLLRGGDDVTGEIVVNPVQ